MTSCKLDIDAFQLPQTCLPSKLRALGVVCLVTYYVPGWEGPVPKGYTPCGASTLHMGNNMYPNEGRTFWFFFPPGASGSHVDPELLADAPVFIAPRAFRKRTVPVHIFPFTIVRTLMPQAGSN